MKIKKMLGCSLLFCFSVGIHAKNTSDNYTLVTISDIHLGAKQAMQLAPSGQVASNDLDLNTFKNILLPQLNQSIATISPQSILVLGDLVDHADGGPTGTPDTRAAQLHNAFTSLITTFPALPINYVFGNNDSMLGDYQQFYDSNYAEHSAYEIAKNSNWRDGFLSTGTLCQNNATTYPCVISDSENLNDGFYAEYLQPQLRLIALNSVLFEGEHASTYHGVNYNGELAWFNAQLDDAAAKGDSVLLAMHVPPAIDMFSAAAPTFWQQTALTQFLTIMKAHPNLVMGILVGHTHMEEIRILDNGNNEIIPIIFTAALSTAHGNVPSFKSFNFSRDEKSGKWSLNDYTAYHYMVASNQFSQLYRFLDKNSGYNCPDSAQTISACMQELIGNLTPALSTLNGFYTAGNPNFSAKLGDLNASDLMISLK